MARTPLRQTDPAQIGRYRLLGRLGAGGMGVVYLGEHQGHQVAVKVLRPELADDPEFRIRFGREVATLTRVQGMCTVRVIEADTEAPEPFLVTEYADGPSLSEYVGAHGPLDPGMLYGLATGLAEALAAIHAAGVVHRDLKPSNVHLVPDRARCPRHRRGAAQPAPAGRGGAGQGAAGPAHRAAAAQPADPHRRAVSCRLRQPHPDRAGPDLASARHRPRRPRTRSGDARAGPGRPSRRRTALLPVVLTLAFLLAAGGTAVGFALAGRPAASHGVSGTTTATTPPTSPAASTSQASTPASTPPSTPASTPATTSATTSASTAAQLPALTVGSYTGMKPKEIAYSGDATNVVTGIRWDAWTPTEATGQGSSDIDSCVPNCAQAPPSIVPTTVTLSAPVNGRFTKMTETRNGFTSTYTYPDNWPESAS